MDYLSSLGIIGGADGPTAVFVVGRFPWEIIAIAAAAICLILIFVLRRKK